MIDETANRDEEILVFDDEEEGNNSFLDDPENDKTKSLKPGEAPSEEPAKKQGVKRGGGLGGQGVNPGSLETDADLVFVIDCTGSMEPFLGMVKEHAKTLYQDIKKGLADKNRAIHTLRIKVIAYRDYFFDWADPEHPPMVESEFFTLPDELDDYVAFVDGLDFAGGEDEPESALEALHLAFNSNWLVDPTVKKRRQIIMLFTDASAHPLDDPMRFDPEFNGHYPEGMPDSLEALYDEFMSPDVFPVDDKGYPTGHRLVLFAPENMYPWDKMFNWTECLTEPMNPETGLEGLTMDDVIAFLAGSLG